MVFFFDNPSYKRALRALNRKNAAVAAASVMVGGLMKKEQRIKKNPEFQQVFRHGASMANRQFVLYRLHKTDQASFRLGLSVSKKIGNAVVRNQVKRYIRQAFLELSPALKSDYDYIVIARKPAADLDFHQTKSSLIHVMGKSNVLNKRLID